MSYCSRPGSRRTICNWMRTRDPLRFEEDLVCLPWHRLGQLLANGTRNTPWAEGFEMLGPWLSHV